MYLNKYENLENVFTEIFKVYRYQECRNTLYVKVKR